MEVVEGEEIWLMHYSSRHYILLVGEGDFSFSLSLATAFGSAKRITATTLDSREDLFKKYKQAEGNVKGLEELGATIIYYVDATRMVFHEIGRNEFDRIVFNFAYVDDHSKPDDEDLIQKNRALVQAFLLNVENMLATAGEVHITLITDPPYSHRPIGKLANFDRFWLLDSVPFSVQDYPGYANKRGAGKKCDAPFALGKCKTYKFRAHE